VKLLYIQTALPLERFTSLFMDNIAKTRMRLKFARLAGAANMSHLDQIKALRGMAAASGLDCMPSGQTRNFVPKMAFGPALSQGYESRCEYADLYLAQQCKEDVCRVKLEAVKSEAFGLLTVKRVPIFFPSIEASVSAAGYIIEADFKGEFSQAMLDAFLARTSVRYEKVKSTGDVETIDMRPLILGAELDEGAGILRLTLKMEPGKNIKPEAALNVMAGREIKIKKVVREELYWLDSKGKLEVI